MGKKLAILAFLFNGLTLLVSKTICEVGLINFIPLYLLFFYSVAFFWGFFTCLIKKIFPRGLGLLIGLSAGLVNFFGSLFMMFALNKIPATIVFPGIIGGNIVLVSLLALFIFKERSGTKAILGIISGLIGLILLTI